MDLISKEDLKKLLLKNRPPCVTFFLPTTRGGAADRIIWKNLLYGAEKRLVVRGLSPARARQLLGPARYLLQSPDFWQSQSDGLAYFLSADLVRSFRLPVPFAAQVTVGDRFHVAPLLPLLHSDGRYFILALSQNRVRLLQGTAFGAHEVDTPGLPTGLAQALRFHDRDEPLMFHTRPTSAGTWGRIFSGQGVGIDDHKDDLLLYFRQIDHGLAQLLHDERAPLVLASVDYLWPIYRKVSTYPLLMDEGVVGNPDRLSEKELHERAWPIVKRAFELTQARAAAQYHQLAGTGRTSNDPAEVVGAAYGGEVAILFVARDREQPGTYDATRGEVEVHGKSRPGDEDLLNFAAVHTLLHAGTVYAVKSDEVPGGGLLAAIYWLPLRRRRK